MPGILGLITRLPREAAERELLQMVRATCSESFYVTGTWSDESLGLYLGWFALPVNREAGVFHGCRWHAAGPPDL